MKRAAGNRRPQEMEGTMHEAIVGNVSFPVFVRHLGARAARPFTANKTRRKLV